MLEREAFYQQAVWAECDTSTTLQSQYFYPLATVQHADPNNLTMFLNSYNEKQNLFCEIPCPWQGHLGSQTQSRLQGGQHWWHLKVLGPINMHTINEHCTLYKSVFFVIVQIYSL